MDRVRCVTCKARRVKCDETKPTCEQCARRRIPCGGYKLDVRWKKAEPKRLSPPTRNRASLSSQTQGPSTSDRAATSFRQVLNDNDTAQPASQNQLRPVASRSQDGSDLSTASVDPLLMSLSSPRSLPFSFLPFSQDTLPRLPSPEDPSHSPSTSPQGLDVDGQLNAMDYAPHMWNTDTFWEDYMRPNTIPLDLGLPENAPQDLPQTRTAEEGAEYIAYPFDQQIWHTFTMEEDKDQNPWKTIVWPLAKDCPAVLHAIAAVTCFGMSKQQTRLRPEGTRHVHQSTQLLAEKVGKGEIALDAALAATLALGFAETWDHETSTGGANHIRAGGILLQQILADWDSTVHSEDEEARVSFLAHTWLYMDVLARFTCSELSQPYLGSTSSPDLTTLMRDPTRLDPLMGYSTAFFPVMRRVADLINKVRARETSRNSPAIISQALEIRRAIEKWNLPIDLETIDDPSQTMTDAIQTAEAYRWSSLLLLYQAVPELPNLTSYGELAQTILVYLATVPLSSTTIIVHTFPLMVAGCDAVEEEDRQFVRERWAAMAESMVPSRIDRCVKVTEELWKRREEYLLKRGLAFTPTGVRINAVSNESVALAKDIASFIDVGTSSASQASKRCARKGNDFPISAAFKKGVDMLTRSGCTEYTVRGRLHWLGVMRDWGWQVMLG